MYLDFQKGHWLSVYRVRFKDAAPPIQMHIQTRFKPQPDRAPESGVSRNIAAYRSFPPQFLVKLLSARIAMIFS